MLDAILAGANAPTNRALGEYFRDLGHQLLAKATQAEADAQALAARRRRTAEYRTAGKAAAAVIEHGAERSAAIAAQADLRGLDPARIAAWLAIEEKSAGHRARVRNRKIMRLAGRGWTDAQIGAHMSPKLHPKSVNRIIRRMLAENPSALPGAVPPTARAPSAGPGGD